MKKIFSFLLLVFLLLSTARLWAEEAQPYTPEEEKFFSNILNQNEDQWAKIIRQNRKVINKELLDKLEQNIIGNLEKDRVEGAWKMALLADMMAPTIRAPQNYRLGLAFFYQHKKEYGKALDICQNILVSDPKNKAALLAKAMILDDAGSYQLAYYAYLEAQKADPNNDQVYLNLGKLYQKIGDKEKAKAALEKALALNPQSTAALALDQLEKFNLPEKPPPGDIQLVINEGEALLQSCQFDEAEKRFREALKIDPKSVPALAGLAATYLRCDRFSEVITLLEPVIDRGTRDADLYRLLGNALERKADDSGLKYFIDRAIVAYNEALKLKPDDNLAKFYLLRAERIKAEKY